MPTEPTHPADPDQSVNAQSTEAPTSVRTRWHKALKAKLHRSRSLLHYRFPNSQLFQEQGYREYRSRKDTEENAKTRLSTDEELLIGAVWGVELFGPSEVDGLYGSLRRLGWAEDQLRSPDRSPETWIARMRMYGREGNFNLGFIQRKGERKFAMADRTAPLPEPVDYMHGYLYQISPSVTAIVLCFVPKETETNAYTAVLSASPETVNEKPWRSRGYRVIDVRSAKERSANEVRRRLRKIAADWFAANIPGFFSLRNAADRFPTAELLITRRQPLLCGTPDGMRQQAPWVRIIQGGGLREVWKSNEAECLSLTWDDGEDVGRYHTQVNLQADLLGEDALSHYGSRDVRAQTYFVNEKIQGVLIRLAVVAYVLEVLRTIRLTRDSFPAESRGHKQILRTVRQIREFFDTAVGFPSTLSELALQAETDHSFRWTCGAFQSVPWRSDLASTEIAETLRARTHHLASRALAQEKEAREHFQQISTILSTQESVRVQRRMETLTVVALVVAVGSLLVALLSLDRVANIANSYIESVVSRK